MQRIEVIACVSRASTREYFSNCQQFVGRVRSASAYFQCELSDQHFNVLVGDTGLPVSRERTMNAPAVPHGVSRTDIAPTTLDPRSRTKGIVRELHEASSSARLELAAAILLDDLGQFDREPIIRGDRDSEQRLRAMSSVLRLAAMLRERFSHIPRTDDVEGMSLRFGLTRRQADVLANLLFGFSEKRSPADWA